MQKRKCRDLWYHSDRMGLMLSHPSSSRRHLSTEFRQPLSSRSWGWRRGSTRWCWPRCPRTGGHRRKIRRTRFRSGNRRRCWRLRKIRVAGKRPQPEVVQFVVNNFDFVSVSISAHERFSARNETDHSESISSSEGGSICATQKFNYESYFSALFSNKM